MVSDPGAVPVEYYEVERSSMDLASDPLLHVSATIAIALLIPLARPWCCKLCVIPQCSRNSSYFCGLGGSVSDPRHDVSTLWYQAKLWRMDHDMKKQNLREILLQKTKPKPGTGRST